MAREKEKKKKKIGFEMKRKRKMTPFFLVVLGLGNSLHGNTQYFSQLFSQTQTWSAVIGIRNQLITSPVIRN